ncbi:MAG: hypothetical protein J6W53_06450 [Candidatus Methanomethylophilaceae archaeon]|nr:hypothetical protein [Candidatus Methanomethylophilaceae archaeon]
MNKWRVAIVLAITAVAIIVTFSGSFDSDADAPNQITISCDHGHIIDVSSGQEYSGAEFTNSITLQFKPNNGYEFVDWVVEGDAEYICVRDRITITDVNGNVRLSVQARNYSFSSSLLNTIDIPELPVPGDSITLGWSFSSSNLDTTKDPWVGSPSVPLIVEDRVYIHAGNYLYCLDSSSGKILHSVSSPVVSNTFYYYISYGNGVIFDTIGHKAYDLELNFLFNIPSNLRSAVYYDGYFYGCVNSTSGYQLYRATADPDNGLVDGVKVNQFKNTTSYNIWAQYGQFSSFYIKNGWIFFLEGQTLTGQRSLTAVNIETEEHDTLDLNSVIGGMYWDDGWLTEYNDYFYVTAYAAGLFGGVSQELHDKHSCIAWAKFDFENGLFETVHCKDIRSPSGSTFQGIASQFVVYKGHGYVNVRALGTDTLGGSDDTGTCLISFDIGIGGEPFEKYACPSSMSHGGLVLNTAHENEGKLYLYLIPYNPERSVYIFTDSFDGSEWKLNSTRYRFETDPIHNQYCSQAIRAGPNGELIFYQDSGWIDCYVPQSKFKGTILVVDDDCATSVSGYGSDIADVMGGLYPQATASDGTISLGGKNYYIYALNEITLSWEQLQNLNVTQYTGQTYDRGNIITHYRYLLLLKDGSVKHFYDHLSDDAGWYYYYDDEYKKCVLYDSESLDDADGQYLMYLSSKPTVNEVIKRNISVNRESTDSLNIQSEPDVQINIRDKTVASVTDEGGTLKITGLKESSTAIVISVGDKRYEISVTVLPKVTVVGDTTVIESHTETVSVDGITIVTDSNTERAGSIQTVNETIVKRNSNGDVIEIVEVTETTDENGDVDEYGNPVKVTERTEIVKDGENNVVTDISVREERLVRTETNGSITVIVVSSQLDNSTTQNTITTEKTTTYGSYSMSEHKVEIYSGNSNEPIPVSSDYVVTDRSGKSTISVEDENATITLSDGSSPNIAFILEMLVQSQKAIAIKSNEMIDGAALEAISDAGAVLSLSTGVSVLEMNSDTIKNLVGKGDVSLTVSDTVGNLSPKQQSAAGDAKMFSIVLRCGDVEQHDFGTFTMSIACDIEIQDGKELKVWRIDDFGKKAYASNVTYSNGIVSFDGDHLSIYAIGYESGSSEDGSDGGSGGEGSNILLFGGIGAVAVLVLLGGVMILRRRH